MDKYIKSVNIDTNPEEYELFRRYCMINGFYMKDFMGNIVSQAARKQKSYEEECAALNARYGIGISIKIENM